jgi:two-component system LytT family sensor kinase
LQTKKVTVLSGHVGLQNVMMRYRLLDHSSVLVHQDADVFRVGFPLIAAQSNSVPI